MSPSPAVRSSPPVSFGEMAKMLKPSSPPSASSRREETWEFRLLFVVSFVTFLVAGIVARALPGPWRPHPPGPQGYKSIFGEAKAAASIFVPFAFMG
jgi:hypothetical protein